MTPTPLLAATVYVYLVAFDAKHGTHNAMAYARAYEGVAHPVEYNEYLDICDAYMDELDARLDQ